MPEPVCGPIGARIRDAIGSADLTLTEAARILGIPASTVRYWIGGPRGDRLIPAPVLVPLALLTGVDVRWLLCLPGVERQGLQEARQRAEIAEQAQTALPALRAMVAILRRLAGEPELSRRASLPPVATAPAQDQAEPE